MSLGSFITKKLRENSTTLYFLSKATGISYPYLLAIVKEQRSNPSYDKLKKISQALNVDIQDVLEAGGFESKKKQKSVSKTVTDIGPQRIPFVPWRWLVERDSIESDLNTHHFRQARYTLLKDTSLYATETIKDFPGIPAGSTLIFQLISVTKIKSGDVMLIKSKKGIDLYPISQTDEVSFRQESILIGKLREIVIKFM